jgi:hypothetical protein
MAFETLVSMVALSLPVWLVAEQIYSLRKSLQNASKRVEPDIAVDAAAADPSWATSSATTGLPAPEHKAA